MLLSDVCLSRTAGLSQEQRGLGRPKLAEVTHVTRDSDTTFKVKRSKVTRPLFSLPCWCVRQLQQWAWNVLAVRNCCNVAVCSTARGASVPTGEERGGAYHGGHPPTACYASSFNVLLTLVG